MVAVAFNPAAWNARRRELRLSYRALGARAGVSEPTVKRILNGNADTASFATVVAILRALGLGVTIEPSQSATQMRREAARRKARELARLVQGTIGLEAQGVDARTLDDIAAQIEIDLLAGPARRLWE